MEAAEFVAVQGRQRGDPPRTLVREPEANDTLVVRVVAPGDQAGGHGAVDEPHCAVVTQAQRVGGIADRRALRVPVTTDREEQLVLGRAQADGGGLLLAPVEEPAQPRAEVKQPGVVLVGKR